MKNIILVLYLTICAFSATICLAWTAGSTINNSTTVITPNQVPLGYSGSFTVTVCVNGTPYGINGGVIYAGSLQVSEGVAKEGTSAQFGLNVNTAGTPGVTITIRDKNNNVNQYTVPVVVGQLSFDNTSYTCNAGNQYTAPYSVVLVPTTCSLASEEKAGTGLKLQKINNLNPPYQIETNIITNPTPPIQQFDSSVTCDVTMTGYTQSPISQSTVTVTP
jgi:hypothetical protein